MQASITSTPSLSHPPPPSVPPILWPRLRQRAPLPSPSPTAASHAYPAASSPATRPAPPLLPGPRPRRRPPRPSPRGRVLGADLLRGRKRCGPSAADARAPPVPRPHSAWACPRRQHPPRPPRGLFHQQRRARGRPADASGAPLPLSDGIAGHIPWIPDVGPSRGRVRQRRRPCAAAPRGGRRPAAGRRLASSTLSSY